jgi:hypothetical protein
MSEQLSAQHAGLEHVVALLDMLWPGDVTVGEPRVILGSAPFAGSPGPLPSSAALLRIGEDAAWVPVPEPPELGPEQPCPAPIYRHADRRLVMPVVRLFEGHLEAAPPSYRTVALWLHDAFTRWRFPVLEKGAAPGGKRTVQQHLEQLGTNPDIKNGSQRACALAALLTRYALFGSGSFFRLQGLGFPRAPMWLRPVEENPIAAASARSLVVTARFRTNPQPILADTPVPEVRGSAYRILPTAERDRGLDPVHTPEGGEIRLTARLGMGVDVNDEGRLIIPAGVALPLSASTARLPFAGYNDPRRLLMAANMQTQAVSLSAPQLPRVRLDRIGREPPGVNLRVAYLAWRGLNHEDAWVLSESAAAKLTAEQTTVQTIALRTPEQNVPPLVKVGDFVERNQLLVERSVIPVFLTDSLRILGDLPCLDETVRLRPETGDRAPHEGEVIRIETWDPTRRSDLPEDWEVFADVAARYQTVYRIHLRRRLPLAVGDKLANRHGHKGVVGAILPDNEMPVWRDQPLEALIDPISVLNRSNWGQVYETLAGLAAPPVGLEAASLTGDEVLTRAREHEVDEHGRSEIQPPPQGDWLREPSWSVAGIQLVMRMPQHARDKLSGSAPPGARQEPRIRRRAQRFGEMDQWALWARASDLQRSGKASVSPAVEQLGRLLATAGFGVSRRGQSLAVGRLALDRPLSQSLKTVVFPLDQKRADAAGVEKAGGKKTRRGRESLTSLYDRLDEVSAEQTTVLTFDPPLQDGPRNKKASDVFKTSEASSARKASRRQLPLPFPLHWLPLLPLVDRPRRTLPDNSETEHELTRCLRRVVRAARDRSCNLDESGRPAPDDDAELRFAVRQLMWTAYLQAVGWRATGLHGNKLALLRRGVLGRRLDGSGRATISPAGPLGLALDEIGLPHALARVLLDLPRSLDERQLAAEVESRRLWLKRDPVLHAWGLVPVRARLVPGDTVRLPASLLGPMGADFDGDTVALFAALPGAREQMMEAGPAAVAWHDLLGRPMFVPGKQYQFGLHRVMSDALLLEELQKDLATAGAPPWPRATRVKDALSEWVRATDPKTVQGSWWAIVEKHALRGLAEEPGMGFGIYGVEALSKLPVVICEGAKDLYSNEKASEAMERILAGSSLEVYRIDRDDLSAGGGDPIADVMVAGKTSIGRFGGALRRLIYSAPILEPKHVRDAQCLTEQVTQKALSVKAGMPPLRYADFERQLKQLLKGNPWQLPDETRLHTLLGALGTAWNDLQKKFDPQAARAALGEILSNFATESEIPAAFKPLKKIWRALQKEADSQGALERLEGVWRDLQNQAELLSALKPLREVWERLQTIMPGSSPASTKGSGDLWLEWLRKPHELVALVAGAPGRVIRIPLDDLRLRCWLNETEKKTEPACREPR